MDQLLNTLSSEVLTEETVKEVSENAGVTPEETIEVVNNAIPALVNSFSQTATRSAATERGAADLMSLLMQATSTNTAQTNNASLGTSLLSTLLGGNNNTNTLVNAISGNTGVKTSGVSKILKYIAPVLISALIKKVLTGNKPVATATITNANTQTNNNANLLSALLGGSQQSQQVQQPQSGVNLSDGLDINDLMGLLGGAQQSQQPTQQKPQSQNNNMNSILSALLGGSQQQSQQVQQPKPQQSSGVNLSDGLDMNDLMALLNGSQQTQQTQQTTQQQSTGTDLTSLLGLLGNLTSTNTAQTTTTTSNKKKKTSSSSTAAQSNSGIDLSDGIDMNDILGLLGTLNKK